MSLYDKRDDFPFDIVQYIPTISNIPINTSYGVFGSQLIRYFRICSLLDDFKSRVSILIKSFIRLGYCKKLLRYRFLQISRKHSFKCKFKNVDTLNSLFT